MKFLDQAKIYIQSGAGGAGCVSFRREKYVEFGGPDGGNGGKGGDVVVRCVDGLNTLVDYRYKQHFRAGTGEHGMGRQRTGASGRDIILKVPAGTQILADDKETLIADLTRVGQETVLLEGGNGGFGNMHFKSSTNRAPRISNPGLAAQDMWIWLRLKLIADAGLVGLPNAGKSTFLSVVSAAKPKIADYPFTTLHPNLGIAETGGREFVVADIPGLIRNAHKGAGIGDRFLGHVERTVVIIHLVDATQDDVVDAYQTIRNELKAYGQGLAEKYEIPVLSKIDALTGDQQLEKIAQLQDATGIAAMTMSSVTRQNVQDVLIGALRQIDRANDEPDTVENTAENKRWAP